MVFIYTAPLFQVLAWINNFFAKNILSIFFYTRPLQLNKILNFQDPSDLKCELILVIYTLSMILRSRWFLIIRHITEAWILFSDQFTITTIGFTSNCLGELTITLNKLSWNKLLQQAKCKYLKMHKQDLQYTKKWKHYTNVNSKTLKQYFPYTKRQQHQSVQQIVILHSKKQLCNHKNLQAHCNVKLLCTGNTLNLVTLC